MEKTRYKVIFCALPILIQNLALAAVINAGAPVILNGNDLFKVYGRVGSFSAEDRAHAIAARVEGASNDSLFSTDSITVTDSDQTTDVNAGDLILVSFTDEDAIGAGVDRKTLASDASNKIKDAVVEQRKSKAPKALWHAVLLTALITFALVVLLYGFNFFFRVLRKKLESIELVKIKPGMKRNIQSVNPDKIMSGILSVLTGTLLILKLFLFFIYIPLVLSLFPFTANLAPTLLGYILNPLKVVLHVTLAYIPNFFFTVMILIVTRYLLKVIRFLFEKIESGSILLKGFHQEWAVPTYKLVRVLVFALALVVIFPYLPGSRSPAFKGVSVFLGVLFSFGSSSAISNLMAGIVLTYMRPFKLGDRVQIADTLGDIVEKSLLVTRVRTIKNVDITIPNSMVLSAHIINYSSSAKVPGLILNATITIGYDAAWKEVHGLLIVAAAKTEYVLKDPKPFVLQTSLDNSYVSYQINAYTHEANRMATIYSELYQNIQDAFNSANVEIMSPTFAAIRDGNSVTIPKKDLR